MDFENEFYITNIGYVKTNDENKTIIGRDIDNNFIVIVCPHDEGIKQPYIKVCDHHDYFNSRNTIRLSLLRAEAFVHSSGELGFWKMNKGELKVLTDFLKSQPKDMIGKHFKTYWERALYTWNWECQFPTWDNDFDDENYSEGCSPNSSLIKEPLYVPMNTKIPNYTKIRFA